jgi:hypothetical protein
MGMVKVDYGNPSGLSGLFKLDPSKFNFSAYAPTAEPEPEAVTDPIAVVSNNTPDAQVDVLEDEGTVAVTVPTHVQQTMNELKGKDLTDDLNVNPFLNASPTTFNNIRDLTSNIPVSSGGNTNGSFLDVGAGQTGISSNVDYGVGAEKAYDLLDGVLESNSDIEDINNYLKSEQFGSYMSEYDDRLSTLGDYKRAEGATTNLLNQVGLSKALGVQGKYGGYKNYTYNGETNQYELTGDTEKSAFEAAAPDIIVGVATAAATAGLGSALGATVGATGAAGTAATNAVASAVVQQLTTGEIDPTKVALAALGGALQGAEAADAAANADLAGAYADFGVDSVEYANALSTANEATSTLEVISNISTGVDIVSAVEDKNIIKAFDLTAGMMDSPTLNATVSKQLSNVVPENYLDAATNAVIRAGSTAIQGGDVGEVLQDSTNEFLIEQYATEKAVQERFGFEGDWAKTASRTISSIATDTLKGDSSQDIALSGLETFLDNAIRLIPEGEDSADYLADAEKWWHENVEDPLQNWWQEVEGTREAIEQPFEDAYNFAVGAGQAALDSVDAGIRAVPTTKKDWEDAVETVNNTVVDPVVETVRETGRQAEDVYDTVEDYVKEEVAPTVRETGRGVREAVDPISNAVRETGRTLEEGYDVVEDYVKEEVAPAVRDTGRDIREFFDTDGADNPDINIPSVDIPDVDTPSVSGSLNGYKRYQDYYYDDTDLVTNPLLSTSSQRIKDLTGSLTQEKEIEKARIAKILADEQERKRRTKPVYGIDPRLTVG